MTKHATTVGHSAWREMPCLGVFLARISSLSTFCHVLEVAFGTARWEPLQISKGSLRLTGVWAEMCSQFPTPSDCKPSDKWLTVLGLWETRAARKLKFSLQKEKHNTAGKKDWQWQKEKAGSSNATGSQQWTTSYIWITSVLQRSWHSAAIPHTNTGPASVGREPHGVQLHLENDPALVQDRDGQAGNMLNEAKGKYTAT